MKLLANLKNKVKKKPALADLKKFFPKKNLQKKLQVFLFINPAATYSPTPLPVQYHRRWRA
jgi:hypothetical protein